MSQPVDPSLRVDDFNYELPDELIAQTPLERRDDSRLLFVDRGSGRIVDSSMRDLPSWLNPGDLVVVNNTVVLPGRLRGRKRATGAKIEFLLLRRDAGGLWETLAKPARKLSPGDRIQLLDREGVEASGCEVEVVSCGVEGLVAVRFTPLAEARLGDLGEAPLPPYIRTRLSDPRRYQTAYGSVEGSAAAPTAGLHLTSELRVRLAERGVGWAEVTLHVGLDTFRPITVERIADHQIHREWFHIPVDTGRAIAETKRVGGRVVAVGTTSARTLETLGQQPLRTSPEEVDGWTDIFITPGHSWSVVDGMMTNFHLPKSTLLVMISAFAGTDLVRRAYAEAIALRYRFFSFGDAMLIL